jgi:hypothetical protein
VGIQLIAVAVSVQYGTSCRRIFFAERGTKKNNALGPLADS